MTIVALTARHALLDLTSRDMEVRLYKDGRQLECMDNPVAIIPGGIGWVVGEGTAWNVRPVDFGGATDKIDTTGWHFTLTCDGELVAGNAVDLKVEWRRFFNFPWRRKPVASIDATTTKPGDGVSIDAGTIVLTPHPAD